MAGLDDRARDAERRQVRYWVKRSSDRVLAGAQAVIAVGGLVVVILINIPWLDGPLKSIGLSDTSALTGSVITVVVVSIFFDVRSLISKTTDPIKRHFSDPMDVYPVLLERITAVSRSEDKVLDVIGMTLYTAWPSIRFWLGRTDLNGWTVRFAAVARGDRESPKHVPNDWFRDARGNLNAIAEYAESPTARLNRINLRAFSYDFMPSLHGYRLGNGDLFYSILLWQNDGNIGIDDYSYEFVPHEDASPSAEAIRGVFDSWFRRATAMPWVVEHEPQP